MSKESFVYPRVLTDGHGCLITRVDGRAESHFCDTPLKPRDIEILERLRNPANFGEYADLAVIVPQPEYYGLSKLSLTEMFKSYEKSRFTSRSALLAFMEYYKRQHQAFDGYWISPESRGDFKALAEDPIRITLLSNTSAVLANRTRSMLTREGIWGYFDLKLPAILRRDIDIHPALLKVATPQVTKTIDRVTPVVFDDDLYIVLTISAYLPEAKLYMPVSREEAFAQLKKSRLQPPQALGEVNEQNIVYSATYSRVRQDLMLAKTVPLPIPRTVQRARLHV